MARLLMISKYCRSRIGFALASVKVDRNETPSIGFCVTPSTILGVGNWAAASIVGRTSIKWANWVRVPPVSLIFAGQETTIGLREPPKCDATCFTHWKGALPAQAQPTG